MPFRRPRNTLISGIGVAGAVLAAVIATFALVSGIVAYDLTSVDQLPRSSDALVLGALRADSRSAKPLVLGRTHAPAAQRGPAPAGPAAAPALARAGSRAPAVTALSPQGERGSDPETEPQQHAGDGGSGGAPPSVHRAPDRPLEPVGDAIGATGEAVGATTESLARRIDAVAVTAGAAVAATRDVVRTTVDRTGRVVGRLLGGSPPR
jgi:hypothetical protein